MIDFDASDAERVAGLPDNDTAIVILEGISMYLRNDEVNQLFVALEKSMPIYIF